MDTQPSSRILRGTLYITAKTLRHRVASGLTQHAAAFRIDRWDREALARAAGEFVDAAGASDISLDDGTPHFVTDDGTVYRYEGGGRWCVEP